MRVEHFADWLQGLGPVGILLLIGAAGVLCLYLLAKGREWRLAGKRAGWNEDAFAEQLGAEGLDQGIARVVYQYLRDEQKIPFPMMPEDSLDKTLGVAGSDLEDTITSVLRLAGRQVQPGLSVLPPDTLTELVAYVQKSPRFVPGEPTPKRISGAFPAQRPEARTSGVVPKAILR